MKNKDFELEGWEKDLLNRIEFEESMKNTIELSRVTQVKYAYLKLREMLEDEQVEIYQLITGKMKMTLTFHGLVRWYNNLKSCIIRNKLNCDLETMQ